MKELRQRYRKESLLLRSTCPHALLELQLPHRLNFHHRNLHYNRLVLVIPTQKNRVRQ